MLKSLEKKKYKKKKMKALIPTDSQNRHTDLKIKTIVTLSLKNC